MAEGLLRHDAGDRFEVFSAGTKPSQVRPEAIAAMGELGIDISGQRSKSVDEFAGHQFDYVLTVCDNAKESCPLFSGETAMIHHNFEDPAALQGSEEERLMLFRRVRDEIREYLMTFPLRGVDASSSSESRPATAPLPRKLLKYNTRGGA